MSASKLAQVDPDIADLLDRELGRQRDTLEMIALREFRGFQKTCEYGLQLLSWHRNLYLMR